MCGGGVWYIWEGYIGRVGRRGEVRRFENMGGKEELVRKDG